MKLSGQQVLDIWYEDEEDFTVVEGDDWVVEGKCQYMGFVFEHKGKTYSASLSRSGSYYSDYEYDTYDSQECPEVEKVTETITREVWKKV